MVYKLVTDERSDTTLSISALLHLAQCNCLSNVLSTGYIVYSTSKHVADIAGYYKYVSDAWQHGIAH